ncbi:Leucine efflux protein [Pseudomonas fluorescens]|jgi:threonine/homoserine/homoserine lactone efflux protein|uniref:Leucine efflux protein n=1 Tax=Pseudomonas fluorescens TaxID=294 RepID=A0A5E7W9D8_PSEFL|nr:LysE family translocator [Pseudomonas fluorescens]VVQ31135.1 Leucine efflux protein [Pseudomonas fluorescens]
MFDIQNYGSFIAAILIFQLMPGPGTFAILNATARNGLGAGFGAVGGTLLGDATYMIAAAIGLAAVMQANPLLFQMLQWFGAAYLCWIGVQLLRAPATRDSAGLEPKRSARDYFRTALAVSLTNPKVILFFVAFFPLFIRPDASSLTLVAMMLHVSFISALYQGLLVLLGNAAARRLKAIPMARKIASRAAGMALVGFGIKLAASNR